jgi:hypothetical protein
MAKKLDWELIRETAVKVGASPAAIHKWRAPDRCGVPTKWWLRISRASGGRISVEDLEAFNRERSP